MSYNPNVPQVGDFTAISQKQLLANFEAISNSMLINHVPLTAVKNQGLHNSLTLRPQSGNPTTLANQSAIYSKLVSTIPQLFFRSNTNQTPIQLSNSNLNTLQTGASPGTQSSFLAGPFTIYMGFIQNCANNQIVTLTPSSTLIYVGLSTVLNSTNINTSAYNVAVATTVSTNQFTVKYQNISSFTPAPTIYYMAVGI